MMTVDLAEIHRRLEEKSREDGRPYNEPSPCACYGDSGPYIEYCERHDPLEILDAAIVLLSVQAEEIARLKTGRDALEEDDE